MRKMLAVVVVLFLLLPVGVTAQGDELEQKFANEGFSFGYPLGWVAGPIDQDSAMAMPADVNNLSETSGTLIMSMFKLTASNPQAKYWPVDADLTFLLGYLTCDLLTTMNEESEYATFGTLETIESDGKVIMSFSVDGLEMSGNVTAIEQGEQRLIVYTMGTPDIFREQEDVMKSIIQSVELKN